MGRARRWAGEVTCDTVMTGELSAVACAAKESTNCQRCIPLVGLRQRRRLAVPLQLERLRYFRRQLEKYVARDGGYIPFAFVLDGVDARSAERERKTPAAQIVTISQIYAT